MPVDERFAWRLNFSCQKWRDLRACVVCCVVRLWCVCVRESVDARGPRVVVWKFFNEFVCFSSFKKLRELRGRAGVL